MNEMITGMGMAVWLGILTSISPCPLATNIAAISYIGKQVDKPGLVFATGLLYTLGRTVAYLVLGIVLVTSLLSAPHLSHWLQKYMPMILGPVLILVGMVLLGLIGQGLTGFVSSESIRSGTPRVRVRALFLSRLRRDLLREPSAYRRQRTISRSLSVAVRRRNGSSSIVILGCHSLERLFSRQNLR